MPETIAVPDVLTLTQSAAEAKVKAAGLIVGVVTKAASSTVPSGGVTSTNPTAGTQANSGSAVDLQVSSGPAPQVAVPDLLTLTQPAAEAKVKGAGLIVGVVTKAASSTVPSGGVTSTNPTAGTQVNSGSAVNLEVSSGAPPHVPVPNVIGRTQGAAEAVLKGAGLVVGAVTTEHSHAVPANGISNTRPAAGELVAPSSSVDLQVSSGPESSSWTQYIPTVLYGLLGLILLVVLVSIVVTANGQTFLQQLADKEKARGLITYLIAVATVGIAVILAISTQLLAEADGGDKRFDRGKQVLSILIGVLGTIVGFYFGADTTSKTPTAQTQMAAAKITTATLPDGTANQTYTSTTLQATGLTAPLKWTVTPTLPDGLVLDEAKGSISGTPKAAKPKTSFKFTVTDSAVPAVTATADLTLEIK
jgi:beta-lactam-binding protein with PASTA domain